MKLKEACGIANKYKAMLEPFCDRIEIAGSIRRQKPEVKDVELVAIPKQQKGVMDLFEGIKTIPCAGFVETVNQWPKVKGESTGKYTQRALIEGINLDLFMATKENWGLIFAIRTGSAEFSHQILAKGWVKAGYKSEGGMLYKDGIPQPIPEETDLFAMIKNKYLDPKDRNL